MQATFGDCNAPKPGFLDFKGKAKWEAWNSKKGLEREAAMSQYLQLVKTLLENHKEKENPGN